MIGKNKYLADIVFNNKKYILRVGCDSTLDSKLNIHNYKLQKICKDWKKK